MREAGRENRENNLLFHPVTKPLVDFCMCPDLGSNQQFWYISTTLQPTELPGQGSIFLFLNQECGDHETVQTDMAANLYDPASYVPSPLPSNPSKFIFLAPIFRASI